VRLPDNSRWTLAIRRLRRHCSIWSGRHELASAPLAFTAAPGTFSGRIALPRAGKAKIYVNAVNGRTGNSGLATVRLP
jgi:hypothetical protein